MCIGTYRDMKKRNLKRRHTSLSSNISIQCFGLPSTVSTLDAEITYITCVTLRSKHPDKQPRTRLMLSWL